MDVLVAEAAPDVLVGAEIADVVADDHQHAAVGLRRDKAWPAGA